MRTNYEQEVPAKPTHAQMSILLCNIYRKPIERMRKRQKTLFECTLQYTRCTCSRQWHSNGDENIRNSDSELISFLHPNKQRLPNSHVVGCRSMLNQIFHYSPELQVHVFSSFFMFSPPSPPPPFLLLKIFHISSNRFISLVRPCLHAGRYFRSKWWQKFVSLLQYEMQHGETFLLGSWTREQTLP